MDQTILCAHFTSRTKRVLPFRQKLEYNSGVVSRLYGETYSVDSFKIGMCNIHDTLSNCSGNCNDYRVGDYCGNSNMKDIANGRPNARCGKSFGPKISIQCLNNTGKDFVSCDAGNCRFKVVSRFLQKRNRKPQGSKNVVLE